MPKLSKQELVYYFSNFSLFTAARRACVTKRFYLKDHIEKMLDPLLHKAFADLSNSVGLLIGEEVASPVPVGRLIGHFYLKWVEDQFYFDVIRCKSKLLCCTVQEYYTPVSMACFRLNDLRDAILPGMHVPDSSMGLFEFCLANFNELLAKLWVDIGLMDQINHKVNSKFLKNFELMKVKQRFFEPLLKLKTVHFSALTDSSHKKIDMKDMTVAPKTEKLKLSMDSLDPSSLNDLLNNIDLLIINSDKPQSFQFVGDFALFVLEVA